MAREDLHERLLATFRVEANEHVQALCAELDSLAKRPGTAHARDRVESLFRVMHTLKGAARSVAASAIEQVCQRGENLLSSVTHGNAGLSSDIIRTLQEMTDELQRLTSGQQPSETASAPPHETGKTVAAPVAPAEKGDPEPGTTGAVQAGAVESQMDDAVARAGGDSVRVDVQRLDRLVLVAEDLLLPSLVGIERVRAARSVVEGVSGLRARMRSAYFMVKDRTVGDWSRAERRAALDSLKDIEAQSRRLLSALADDQRTLRHIVGELFQETRQSRMLPASVMLAAFPMMIRDLCRETGKKIKWRTSGSEVELDRKVFELVKDPLIHLVRNAVDHGIELPDEREAAGKARRGTIKISIVPIDGGRLRIEVSDDGCGFDLQGLRDAAVRSRAGSAALVQAMPDEDVIALAFRAGLSTSPVITSLSGHGLGLAIVREQVERIDGTVTVNFVPKEGTRICIEVPTSIASYRGLHVSVGGSRLLWPAESVDRVVGIPKAEAQLAHKAGFAVVDGESLPYIKLAGVLGLRSGGGAAALDRRMTPCVIAHNGPRRAIVEVDDIHGEAEVMIKDLPSPLRRVRYVASAGLLATGELALVLRASDVMSATQTAQDLGDDGSERAEDRALRVLIVDDSITTRTMERNLFESAGYAVSVAADGIEAWDRLQSEEIDLVVSDVDMPRMNGFELTSKIRADSRLANLPVVLVTALESREDKERGVRIGANAYVLKSSFDQSSLLEIVGRLV